MPLQPFTSLKSFSTSSLSSQHSDERLGTAFKRAFGTQQRPRGLQIAAAIKKRAEKHVVCSKTLVAKPGQEKRVQKKCQDILDFSLGKAANKSNGIVEFVCSQDLYESNVFHFWERYDGNVSLGRHNTTPEFQKFMESVSGSLSGTWLSGSLRDLQAEPLSECACSFQVQEFLEEPIGLALYAYQDGNISHVCVQGGMWPESISKAISADAMPCRNDDRLKNAEVFAECDLPLPFQGKKECQRHS